MTNDKPEEAKVKASGSQKKQKQKEQKQDGPYIENLIKVNQSLKEENIRLKKALYALKKHADSNE